MGTAIQKTKIWKNFTKDVNILARHSMTNSKILRIRSIGPNNILTAVTSNDGENQP